MPKKKIELPAGYGIPTPFGRKKQPDTETYALRTVESMVTQTAAPLEETRSTRSFYLRLFPDSVLRELCDPVECFSGWLTETVDEMFELMREHRGIGLAAPQVGITQSFFIAEMDGRSLCLTNPSIVSSFGLDRRKEGCLSLPDVFVDMERRSRIEIMGYDLSGKKRQEVFQGLWASVILHEMDHLKGILISDHILRFEDSYDQVVCRSPA